MSIVSSPLDSPAPDDVIDRFAGALFAFAQARISRKQLLALWDGADAAWAGSGQTRLRLADALNRLEQQGIIELPAPGGPLWDRSLTPLPHRITVPANRSPTARAMDPASEPWVPELSWAPGWIRSSRPPQQLRWAVVRINQWLLTTTGQAPPRVAREERSLHIFDDEKQLALLTTTALFADGRLSLDTLACDRPLGSLRIARLAGRGRVLVVENKSTFDSIWRALSSNTGTHDYAAVIFGGGDAAASLAPELGQLPKLNAVTPTFVEYAGDVDIAGIEAAYAFSEAVTKQGLAVTMASPLWDAVARARPTGEDLTAGKSQTATSVDLAQRLRLPETVIDRLYEGARVPQERIDRTALSDIRWWARGQSSLVTRGFDHHDSARLLRDYAEERREVVGFVDPPSLDKPSEYQPPSGMFVIAYTDAATPIACGGIRTYRGRENVFEIRKMYVAPQYRGQGIARHVLTALEQHASAQGADEVLLETGSYNQAALRLYTSAGYELIPPYVQGRPSFNRAFKKRL